MDMAAELVGIMLRRKPKQFFTVLILWNLSAFWRRIKKFEWPWASYNPISNQELQRDRTTIVTRYAEKYLRPTKDINPYEPEIVALAMKLGMNEKSKREYAEAACNYVKNNIRFYLEVPPIDPVDVLKKGYGLCISKLSVLAALARVAGIPARFVFYEQEMAGGFISMMAEEMAGGVAGEVAKDLEKSRPTFGHGCLELFLDGEWVSADTTWTEEEEVGMDIPISQFGESPFGKWYYIMPDSVSRHEDFPWSATLSKLYYQVVCFILRGLFDKVNERFNQLRERGRKKLKETSREDYIRSKRKFYVPPPPLIFDEEEG
jgi:hypothetical protein